MAKADYPVTTAVRFLRAHGIDFIPHVYEYEEHGGTAQAAREVEAPEHEVIKTIVLENEQKKGLIVLMHGDRQISTRNLARELGMKHIEPADPRQANKWTGYLVGVPARSARRRSCRCMWSVPFWICRGFSSMAASAGFRWRFHRPR